MSDEQAKGRSGEGAVAPALPKAALQPERRLSAAWLVPVVALLLAGGLAFAAWRERGVVILVQLTEGHGLKVGDHVRYRGITVGAVRDVSLIGNGEAVRLTIGLQREANILARAGSRFWVVRARLRLSGAEGLETLVGPRYLAALPGPESGARQREFVGLAEPPVVEAIEPGDIEVILETVRRGSLRAGAPVSFRQVRIGTVLSVGLASDGSRVEARVHVEKAYRQLIRERTRFWDSGGVRSELGLSGFTLEMESLEEALSGGVALATPPPEDAGNEIHTGHRFLIHDGPENDWLEWEPTVALGSSLLPPGSRLPRPLRATIGWKAGFILKGSRSRHGWVLQTEKGLLGPENLLTLPEGRTADPETASLEVAGAVVPLGGDNVIDLGLLARLEAQVAERQQWPDHLMRAATVPEDCIAVGDPTAEPFPLAASRLERNGGSWTVDRAVSVDEVWHGACVLARSDGRLVGFLLVDDEDVRVALLPAKP